MIKDIEVWGILLPPSLLVRLAVRNPACRLLRPVWKSGARTGKSPLQESPMVSVASPGWWAGGRWLFLLIQPCQDLSEIAASSPGPTGKSDVDILDQVQRMVIKMSKGLEYLSQESEWELGLLILEEMRELELVILEKTQDDLINVYKYLSGGEE